MYGRGHMLEEMKIKGDYDYSSIQEKHLKV